MAASATMQLQSILATPMTSGSVHGARSVSQQLSSSLPPLRRRASLRVQCMAEESKDSTVEGTAAIPPPPPPKPKVSTKFGDVLAFSGPAPERVNGRLAMVGFVAAVGVELANGNDLLAQISNGSGVAWFVGTSVVLTLASLVPLFQGVTVQSKSEGLMTSDAEMWNGRVAMLGLVALAFTEYVKGGALI